MFCNNLINYKHWLKNFKFKYLVTGFSHLMSLVYALSSIYSWFLFWEMVTLVEWKIVNAKDTGDQMLLNLEKKTLGTIVCSNC